MPIHGPGGCLATVSVGSAERSLDLSPRMRLHLQMAALLAHDRCRVLAADEPQGPPRAALSQREFDCVRWVAAGKIDWEIGVILGISAATVKFHVDRARDKLGTCTRAQAVARIALSGLL